MKKINTYSAQNKFISEQPTQLRAQLRAQIHNQNHPNPPNPQSFAPKSNSILNKKINKR